MDTELVVRAQGGDLDAFAALAAPLYGRLQRIAYAIVGDAGLAEDATQQAMLDVWRRLPSLRDPARFEAWCYRTLTNACASEGRRKRRWMRVGLSHPITGSVASDPFGATADRDLLDRAFERLSADQRTVVVLHYYADLTHERVAEVLDIPIGTVRSRIHRAMEALRAAIDADERAAAELSASTEAAR